MYQVTSDAALLDALAGAGKRKPVKLRGLPIDASFETWLCNQRLRGGLRPLKAKEVSWLRMAHLIGVDCSHLVQADPSRRGQNYLDASELARLLKARQGRDRALHSSWTALHVLLKGLSGGRIVYWFND